MTSSLFSLVAKTTTIVLLFVLLLLLLVSSTSFLNNNNNNNLVSATECWVRESNADWYMNSRVTTDDFTEARATCDALGLFLPDGRHDLSSSSTSLNLASYWSGLVVLPNTNGSKWYYHSGAIPPETLTDVTATSWTSDEESQCWRFPGGADNTKLVATKCTGGGTKYPVVCQKPVGTSARHVEDMWVAVKDSGSLPIMAATVIPYRTYYDIANQSCHEVGGELAYVPSSTFAETHYWPVIKKYKYTTGVTTNSDYRCPATGARGLFVGNKDTYVDGSPYRVQFGTDYISDIQGAPKAIYVDFTSTGSYNEDTRNGATGSASGVYCGSLCTRMIDQVSVRLMSSTCTVNQTVNVRLQLRWSPPRDVTILLTTTNANDLYRARPVYNSYTFSAGAVGGDLTTNIPVLCIASGTATLSAKLDAVSDRWALGRAPQWENGNTLTVNDADYSNYISVTPSSLTLRTGQAASVEIKKTSGNFNGDVLLAVLKKDLDAVPCIQFAGPASFSSGENTKNVTIIASRDGCTSQDLKWTLIPQTDTNAPDTNLQVSLSVTVKHKIRVSRSSSSDINLYDSGYLESATDITFDLNDTNSNMYHQNFATVIPNISTCVGNLVVTPSSLTIGDSSTFTFSVYSNEIYPTSRSCELTFTINSTDSDHMYDQSVFHMVDPDKVSLSATVNIRRMINFNSTFFPWIINETTPKLELDYYPTSPLRRNGNTISPGDIRFRMNFNDSRFDLKFPTSDYFFPLPSNFFIEIDAGGDTWSVVTPTLNPRANFIRPAQYQHGLPSKIVYGNNIGRLPRFRIFPTRIYTNQTFYVNVTTATPTPSNETFNITLTCGGSGCPGGSDSEVARYNNTEHSPTIGNWVTFPLTTLQASDSAGSMTIILQEWQDINGTISQSNFSMDIPTPGNLYQYTMDVLPACLVSYNLSNINHLSSTDTQAVIYQGTNEPLILYVGEGINPIETGSVNVSIALSNTSCASVHPPSITLTQGDAKTAQPFYIWPSNDYSCINNKITLTQTSTDPSHLESATISDLTFSVEPLFKIKLDYQNSDETSFTVPRSSNVELKVRVSTQDANYFPLVNISSQIGNRISVFVKPVLPDGMGGTVSYSTSPTSAVLTSGSDIVNVTITITSGYDASMIIVADQVLERVTQQPGGTNVNIPRRFSQNEAPLIFYAVQPQAILKMSLDPAWPWTMSGVWAGQTAPLRLLVVDADTLPGNSSVDLSGSGGLSFSEDPFSVTGNQAMSTKEITLSIAAATTGTSRTITASISSSDTRNQFLSSTARINVYRLPTQSFEVVSAGTSYVPGVLFSFDKAELDVGTARRLKASSNYPQITTEQLDNTNNSNLLDLRLNPSSISSYDPRQNSLSRIDVEGLNFTMNQSLTITMSEASSSAGSTSIALPSSQTLNFFARERMIPYMKDLPEEIFVGSQNKVDVQIITGSGFADVVFDLKVKETDTGNDLTASNFFDPASFTITGKEGFLTPTVVSFSSNTPYDNITVYIQPRSVKLYHVDPFDQWAQNYFVQPPRGLNCEILGLRIWNMTMDSTILWGPRDYITLTFNLEKPARVGWDVMTTVKVNETLLNISEILESKNSTFFATFKNSDKITTHTLLIQANSSFDFAGTFPNVTDYDTVVLAPTILDWLANKYNILNNQSLQMSRSRLTYVEDVDPLGHIFIGERGLKTVKLSISDLPKEGRKLVIKIGCNVSANMNFSQTEVFWTSDNVSKETTITIGTDHPTAEEYLNFTFTIDETQTTAVEFLPADTPQPHIVMKTKDLLEITTTKNWGGSYIPSTSTTRHINFTTENRFLTVAGGNEIQLKPTSADSSVLAFDPSWNVSWVGTSSDNKTTMREFDPSGLPQGSAPRTIELSFPYEGPQKYYPGPSNFNLTVFHPRPINITRWVRRGSGLQRAENRKYYKDADFGVYYIKVDLPNPYETYYTQRNVVLDISCDNQCVKFYPENTPIRFQNCGSCGSVDDGWSQIINFTAETDQECNCTFRFTSNERFLIEEFANPVQHHIFRGYDRVGLGGTLSRQLLGTTEETMVMYEEEAQNLILYTNEVLRDICEIGDRVDFRVSSNASSSSTLTLSASEYFNETTANVNLRYIRSNSLRVSTAQYVRLWANMTSTDCYAIQPATFDVTYQIVKKVPIYIYALPTRSYIDNNTKSYMTFTPPSSVPIPSSDKMVIDLWYDGPAGSIDIGNNNTFPETIKEDTARSGGVRYQNWTLTMPIPTNQSTTTVWFNITGIAAQETPQNISCAPRSGTGAEYAFSHCIVVTSVKILSSDNYIGVRVPSLLQNANYSLSPDTRTALSYSGANEISSSLVLAKLLVGESFDVFFNFSSDDCDIINPRTVLWTDSDFLNISDVAVWTSTTTQRIYRYRFTVVNSSFDYLDPNVDSAGTPGGFMLNIEIRQNARRFLYLDSIRIVTYFVPVVSISRVAPRFLRVNRANALTFNLSLDRPPRRHPVNLTLSSLTNLVFEHNNNLGGGSPGNNVSWILWNVGESPNKTITVWGTSAYDNASVLFSFNHSLNYSLIEEMTASANSTDEYRIKIMNVGALRISGMIKILFEGSLNLFRLQPDFEPLSQPLIVDVEYSYTNGKPKGEYVEVVQIVDIPRWYPGTSGSSREVTMEVSAATSTDRVSHPMLYKWNSTEYDRVECMPGNTDVCKELAVYPQAVVEIVLNGQSGLDIVLFPNETYQFEVRAASCNGASVEARLSLPEFPLAVEFIPSTVSFTCGANEQESAPKTVTVRACDCSGETKSGGGTTRLPCECKDGEDVTPRSTSIEADLTTNLPSVPESSSKVQLKANLAVHSPAILPCWVSSLVTYTGSSVNFTMNLPRKPAKGYVGAKLVVQGGVAASMPSWNTSVEQFLTPDTLRKTVIINVPQNQKPGLLNITVSLEGAAAGEYILNETTFQVEVRLPERLMAYMGAKERRFVYERYPIWVAAQEIPEANTSISVFVNVSVWKQRFTDSDPWEPLPEGKNQAIRFEPSDTVTFLDNATSLNTSTTLQVILPCTVTFSFLVFPDRRQFNKTLIPSAVLKSALNFSRQDQPQIRLRPENTQFVLERNTQTFSVRVDFLPLAGFLRFYPVMKTVRLDGRPYTGPQLPVLYSPSLPVTLEQTSREREIIFFVWNNSATPAGLTTEIYVEFDNASTGQYNLTTLYIGSVHFTALHTVLPLTEVKGVENSLFISYEGIAFEVPCVVTGLPPINTSYEIGIGGQIQTLTIEPLTVTFHQNDQDAIRINSTDNTKVYYMKKFKITGLKRSQNIVRFISLTKLAVAPMFDAGEVSFRVNVVAPLNPLVARIGPIFGGSGRGEGSVSDTLTMIDAFVGDVNTQLLQVTMQEKDVTAKEIKVSISTSAGSDIIALNPAVFTFTDTETYPTTRTFTLRALKGGNQTVSEYSFNFKVEGSSMYAESTSVPLRLTEQYVFGFTGLPLTIFAGAGNARYISIAPQVIPPTPLFLVLSVGCAEVTVFPTELEFNNTRTPRQIKITGVSKSNPCLVTASQDPLKISATFLRSSLISETQSDTVTVNPAPALVPELRVQDKIKAEVSASDLRSKNIVLTLSLITDAKSKFVPTKNMSIDFRNESAITIISTLSSNAAPFGTINTLARGQLRTIIDVVPAGTSISFTLLRTPEFTIFDKEVLTFKLNANAIINETIPDLKAVPPSLTILPDEKLPPRRSARVTTASVAVSASFLSGLASATAASQAGYLLAAASVADCPSVTWMEHIQNNMPAYVSPIPLDFGVSNAELGGFAGGLVGNFLSLAIWAVVHFGLVVVIKRLRGLRSYDKPAALMRFPGLLWLPGILLLQPTVCLAALLVLYSPRTDFKMLGAFGLVVAVVLLPFAAFRVHSNSAELEYEDPPKSGTFITRLLRRGTYEHPEKPYWVGQFGFPLQALRYIRRWYFMLEITTLIILGFIAALQPTEVRDCIMRAFAMLIILIGHLIIVIVVKPYSALLDTIFWSVGYLLQIIAISIVVDAQIRGGDIDEVSSAYDSAGSILSGFAVIFMIYGLISLCYLVAEVLQKCEDPRDPASRRKKNLNSNIQQFAEELKRMDLENGVAAGGVHLNPNGSADSDDDDSDDDDDNDSDEELYFTDSDGEEEGAQADARRRRRRARARRHARRTGTDGNRNISAAIRLSVTATQGDKKTGAPTRYGFQRAFDPTVVALDGGGYDARERDRRMIEEERNARDKYNTSHNLRESTSVTSASGMDYSRYTDHDANSEHRLGGREEYKTPSSVAINGDTTASRRKVPATSISPYVKSSSFSSPREKTKEEIMAAWGITEDENQEL